MWEFYLAGREAAAFHTGLVVFQIQLSKRIDAVPLTATTLRRVREQAASEDCD